MKYYHFYNNTANYLVIILSDSEEKAKKKLESHLESNRNISIEGMKLINVTNVGYGKVVYSGYET